VSFSEHINFS